MGLASGSGLAVGSGAGAFFSDRETFANNSITAGAVDLNVNWSTNDESGTSEGEPNISIDPGDKTEGEIDLTVAPKDASELPDGESNPVYPWFRVSCPENVELADNIVITLKYGGEVIIDQPLLVAAALLRNGQPLYPRGDPSVGLEGRECLSAGDSLDLVFEWEIKDEGEFDGDNGVAFPIEFLGRQCRHNDGTASPFPERGPCPDEGQTISWIAFCRRESDPTPPDPTPLSEDDIEIEPILTNSKVPTSVMWQLEEDVDYVIIFGGGCWTLYNYTGVSITKGVATTEGRTDYDKWLSCNKGCDNRPPLKDALTDEDGDLPDKFCNESEDSDNGAEGSDNGASGSQGSGNGSSCGYNSCPCEVAEQIFKNGSFDGASIKFDVDDNGEFIVK